MKYTLKQIIALSVDMGRASSGETESLVVALHEAVLEDVTIEVVDLVAAINSLPDPFDNGEKSRLRYESIKRIEDYFYGE